MACNNGTEKDSQNNPEEKATETAQTIDKKTPAKTTTKGTYLCKINGEDWAYTKASGIVSTHAKTKERTALITFKRKLEKGSENIQLYYDANTFELIKTTLQLKFKNKDGKLFTCYYEISPPLKKHSPQNTMSGNIDISNSSSASGTAEITNINIRYEKGKLLDSKNGTISLTDLKFSGVGYSDTDKPF